MDYRCFFIHKLNNEIQWQGAELVEGEGKGRFARGRVPVISKQWGGWTGIQDISICIMIQIPVISIGNKITDIAERTVLCCQHF